MAVSAIDSWTELEVATDIRVEREEFECVVDRVGDEAIFSISIEVEWIKD